MKTVLVMAVTMLLQLEFCNAQDIADFKDYLKHFDNVRGHVPNSPATDANRKKVRDFMKTTFEAVGLEVHLQNFTSKDTNTGKDANGTNVIAILKGSNYGTADDQVIILAAHYDTVKQNAGGVNNDGSGLVGLLSIAEALKGKDSCTRNNSVIFAAFDRAETATIGQNITQCKKSCGSQAFIQNKATYVKAGKIKLVIVMDCIANVEFLANSQYLAPALSKYFNTWYTTAQLSDSRGDYLAITGRNNEKSYIDEIKKTFEANKVSIGSSYTAEAFQWNIDGVPTVANKSEVDSAFQSGDHMSFWDANIHTVLLTDTCYSRNPYRTNCDLLNTCDTQSKLVDNDYKFMLSAVNTVKMVTMKYTCGDDIDECKQNPGPCSKDATCLNTASSYQCTCKQGFSGDGKTCTDINECDQSPSPCSKDASCRNVASSYGCTCNVGFTGDGKTCSANGSVLPQVLPQLLVFGLAMILSYHWI